MKRARQTLATTRRRYRRRASREMFTQEVYLNSDSEASLSDDDAPEDGPELIPPEDEETLLQHDVDVGDNADDDADDDQNGRNASSLSEGDFSGFEDTELINMQAQNFAADFDAFMEKWEKGDRATVPLDFRGKQGLRQYADVAADSEPMDFLNLFICENLYNIIADETNRYATQYLEANQLSAKSRFNKWTETTAEEIKVFLALCLAMGICYKSDTADYWCTHDVVYTPLFPNSMPRDRFWLIMTFLHLADNTKAPGRNSADYSPINKLGRVYNNIIHRFETVYHPGQRIALDEGMIPWKGNLSFKTYNKDKPHKYGMKAYMLCDSANGYCFKFKLYTGKTVGEDRRKGLIFYDLIMNLTQDLRGKGHHLFTDNLYTSPQLYVNLWQLGIGGTGTVRVNRKGVPPAIKPEVVAKSDVTAYHNENLLVCKYHDHKYVYLLSTVECAEIVDSGRRNRKTGEPVMRPSIVVEYDKYMGAVDRADQMLSYYPVPCKTLKWWKRILFHVINLAVVNAYVIYKGMTNQRRPMKHREFRREVIATLLKNVNNPRPAVRNSRSHEPIYRLTGRHFIQSIQATGKKQKPTRQCAVCSPAERNHAARHQEGQPAAKKKKRYGRESRYECKTCKVTLCIEPCFELYHTARHFTHAYLVQKYGAEEDQAEEAVGGDTGDDNDDNIDDSNPSDSSLSSMD